MNKFIPFILRHPNPHYRRKLDHEPTYSREVALENWFGEKKVKVVKCDRSCDNEGEYGYWRRLCQRRRELFELRRQNDV